MRSGHSERADKNSSVKPARVTFKLIVRETTIKISVQQTKSALSMPHPAFRTFCWDQTWVAWSQSPRMATSLLFPVHIPWQLHLVHPGCCMHVMHKCLATSNASIFSQIRFVFIFDASIFDGQVPKIITTEQSQTHQIIGLRSIIPVVADQFYPWYKLRQTVSLVVGIDVRRVSHKSKEMAASNTSNARVVASV